MISLYPENLSLPAIVPTPGGNLLLEWSSAGNPSVDIRVAASVGEFHSFDPEGNDVEEEFALTDEGQWKAFFKFLSRTIRPNPA